MRELNTQRKYLMPPKRRKRTKKLIAFSWYGGKFAHLSWILSMLPKCHHYCEPFAGSGVVLLNRKPSPVETYNDIDGEACNFFRVLRNQKNELINLLKLTPYSREEFNLMCDSTLNLSKLERARLFFIRARQSRNGLTQDTCKANWAYSINKSSRNMSANVSSKLNSIDNLSLIVERLLRVQIENKPAIDILTRYDSNTTLFYCDPPYVHSTRTNIRKYRFEMTNDEHILLANILNKVIGKVALSGYRCDLMEELYLTEKWYITERKTTTRITGKDRTEILWTNYNPINY